MHQADLPVLQKTGPGRVALGTSQAPGAFHGGRGQGGHSSGAGALGRLPSHFQAQSPRPPATSVQRPPSSPAGGPAGFPATPGLLLSLHLLRTNLKP